MEEYLRARGRDLGPRPALTRELVDCLTAKAWGFNPEEFRRRPLRERLEMGYARIMETYLELRALDRRRERIEAEAAGTKGIRR